MRLEPEVERQLYALAAEEDRTISNMVERIVKDYLRSRGLLGDRRSEIPDLKAGQGKLLMREDGRARK